VVFFVKGSAGVGVPQIQLLVMASLTLWCGSFSVFISDIFMNLDYGSKSVNYIRSVNQKKVIEIHDLIKVSVTSRIEGFNMTLLGGQKSVVMGEIGVGHR